MPKGPGSKSGIGVNYRPPGYRAVARGRVDDPLAGDTAKKKAPPASPPVNPPAKQAAPEPAVPDTAASPPPADPGEKPK